MNPIPLLTYTPRPPRYRAKFRVMIPDREGKPTLLSHAVGPYQALRIAEKFRRQDTVAVIWADTRSLRDLYAHAPERGVRRFEAIFHQDACPCGCGRDGIEIIFPPAMDPPAVSQETPATKAIVVQAPSPLPTPQASPAAYVEFAKHVLSQVFAAVGIPLKFL